MKNRIGYLTWLSTSVLQKTAVHLNSCKEISRNDVKTFFGHFWPAYLKQIFKAAPARTTEPPDTLPRQAVRDRNRTPGHYSWLSISSIFDKCPGRLIMRFTAKPYILWKSSFHWICSKFYKFQHGHDFSDLWPHEGCSRPKTPLGGQKRHEGVELLKRVFNKSCSTTSKTP